MPGVAVCKLKKEEDNSHEDGKAYVWSIMFAEPCRENETQSGSWSPEFSSLHLACTWQISLQSSIPGTGLLYKLFLIVMAKVKVSSWALILSISK